MGKYFSIFNRKLVYVSLLIFCSNVFADTLEPQAEVPKDSVNEFIVLLNLGFNLNGSEMSYVFQKEVKNYFTFRYGPGLGIYVVSEWEFILMPLFFNIHFGLQKSNFEYFFNNRLGANMCYGVVCDLFYEPSVGIQFNNLNLSFGYNYNIFLKDSYAIHIGYRHDYEKADSIKKSDVKKKGSRYFRPGLELNYPVWRSRIDFFDNSFPYVAGGAGLFFRIGPESIYFTTGVYVKWDVLEEEYTRNLGIFGINMFSLPLLELRWERGFVEIPLLLSFGIGQIRFVAGALFDFYAHSEISLIVLEEGVLSFNDASEIEKRFSEVPSGNMYWVLGSDIDIVRHWGIGVKYLIWDHSWSEFDIPSVFEPNRFQTRVSTYFVF